MRPGNMKTRKQALICIVLFLFEFPIFGTHAIAQAPSLFMTLQDFRDRAAVAQREPWAKASLQKLIQDADAFPKSYETQFGLSSVELPPEGGEWIHWYVCPETGTPLQFRPPNHNVCPDTGKEFPGYPFDQVVYQLRNDALHKAAITLALAYRFTDDKRYAKEAIQILSAYADRYQTWPLHDNHGKPTANGAKAYSQTLDESIWLIDIAWTYDLVRGSGLLDQQAKTHIERDLLRASYTTVSKAHKEPTDNIQSWINAAIAAVGFTLHDNALISEAIDGPIGFRYQMKHFVRQGFWIEGAFGYHFYALRALVATAQMAKRAEMNLWSQEPVLLSLFTGPLGILLPNGELPAFNDSNPTDLFAQDFLYEQAYAVSRNSRFLPIIEKYGRTSREALLFGVERLPPAPTLEPKSEVFAEAGYAALRSKNSDLTVIAKFGEHGGAHGHYDKLSFVLYSQGRVMGIDPGTQLYGLPLHRQWDSMTIAHNTVSVDEKRQAAATGKLLNWQTGPDWVAVTMDAGPIYEGVKFERSILLTSAYCLIFDRVQSSDSAKHTVDWIYHNRGKMTMEQPTNRGQAVDKFPDGSGYQVLQDVKATKTDGEIKAVFIDSANSDRERSNPNSPSATTRSATHQKIETKVFQKGTATIELTMLADPGTQVFSGLTPGHDLRISVPFVLARKNGSNVKFTSVLSPIRNLTVQQSREGQKDILQIKGIGLSAIVQTSPKFAVERSVSNKLW